MLRSREEPYIKRPHETGSELLFGEHGIIREANSFGRTGAGYTVRFAVRSGNVFDAIEAVREATSMLEGVSFKRHHANGEAFELGTMILEAERGSRTRMMDSIAQRIGGGAGEDTTIPTVAWKAVEEYVPETGSRRTTHLFYVEMSARGYAYEDNQKAVDSLWKVAEALRQKYEAAAFEGQRSA